MKRFGLCLTGTLTVLFLVASFASAQKLKPEEIIAKHLEAIGTAEARAAVKSQTIVGDAKVVFVSQKNMAAQGRVVMASAGPKNFFGLQLNAVDYPGEKFSFNGTKTAISALMNGKRSVFGDFVDANELGVRESLFAGVLASSWAMNDIASKKVKLGSGSKKIDGKEYYTVDYNPKSGSDFDITLYFEKDTFRHARTEYKRTKSGGIGNNPNQSSQITQNVLKVVETYSDFRDEKGLMMPHVYKLNYSETGQGGSVEIEWEYALNDFQYNQPLDEKTFDINAK
ncbi:MAG TPA: hypothetical protein VJV05_15765 [Pyrinomonadaceae bacterium]|nr:hypothetical protein [Pyrinomonadaceae bacterium]